MLGLVASPLALVLEGTPAPSEKAARLGGEPVAGEGQSQAWLSVVAALPPSLPILHRFHDPSPPGHFAQRQRPH